MYGSDYDSDGHILGEGNPDEEKIGAFGVGQFLICSGSELDSQFFFA